ncbi:MAG TPA: alanine racemase, partial [Actinomycetota bacterium]|nr:alanine racemase [Actinomycetota bacterium]
MSAAAAGAGAAVEATKHVLERVAGAAERAGRRPDEVRLVAVTKGVDVGLMDAYLAAGIARDLGENRAQELDAKHSALAHRAPRWHFIGTLQRNKAGLVVGRAVSIHSVDSERLARAIGDKATALGIAQRVLLEVNTSGEVSKHGVTPGEAADVAHAVAAVSGVELGG